MATVVENYIYCGNGSRLFLSMYVTRCFVNSRGYFCKSRAYRNPLAAQIPTLDRLCGKESPEDTLGYM